MYANFDLFENKNEKNFYHIYTQTTFFAHRVNIINFTRSGFSKTLIKIYKFLFENDPIDRFKMDARACILNRSIESFSKKNLYILIKSF